MSEEPSDGGELPSANHSWPDTAQVDALILSAMPSGYKGLFAPRLQEQAELRQRERAVQQAQAEAAKAEKAAKIAELAPGRRRIVVRHFLSHMPYWSSLEVAFLTLAPGTESDPVGKWREMMHMRLAEAIKAKWTLHRNNELTQAHSKVLTDFNAPSNDPIEIPRALAAKYLLDLNLPHLTEASFTKAVLDEVRAIVEGRPDDGAVRLALVPDTEDLVTIDANEEAAPNPLLLTEKQQAVYDLIRQDKPQTGKQILNALADVGTIMDQSTLTTSIIPALKKAGLVFSKKGRGYLRLS
jgi:hypothetical protein